jgi:hypothetical protein
MANRFWVGGAGNWSDTAKWSTTSGGAGGASVPVAADIAIFDANSDAGSDFTAAVDAAITITTLTITSVDVLVTIADTQNLTVTGGGTWSSANAASGIKFTSNVTFGDTVALTSGILDITNVTLTVKSFSSSNSNVRSVIFGSTGKIVLTGDGVTVWNTTTLTNLTYSGNAIAELVYSGSVGTRSIIGGFPATVADNLISIKVIGGSDILRLFGSHNLLNVDFGDFAGSLNTDSPRIWGNLTLSPLMTILSSANGFAFYALSGTQIITSNGTAIDRPIFIGQGASTATFQLADNFTVGSTRTIDLSIGAFDANNHNVDCGRFSSSSASVRTINMGSGIWTLRGESATSVWNIGPTNLTFNSGTSTIVIDSSTAQNFFGGTRTYYDCVLSGAGTVTFDRANFNKLSNTVQPITVKFLPNITYTFNDFALSGTENNPIEIVSSTVGTRTTLSQASGIINVQYANIKDTNAIGGANWNAINGAFNTGNNRGWYFAHQQNAFYPAGMF